MGEIVRLHPDPHEEAQLLLPWYVTRQADAASLARVARHLVDCEECRADLVLERAMHGAIREMAPAGGAAFVGLSDPSPERIGRSATWAPVGRVAAAILAFLVLTPGGAPAPAPYRALGTPITAPGNLLIMVTPSLAGRAMSLLLARSGARLVSGPTAAGAYVLRVAPPERRRALQRLRASSGVTLAEPIDAGPAQ